MASTLEPAPPPLHEMQSAESTYGDFIEREIRKTRARVKGAEVFGASMLLVAGVLLYLLAVVLADHWLVAGGLSTTARLLCLFGFLGGVGAFVGLILVPMVLHRVNPVYAAHMIERTQPTLKNSLLNFLLLRRESQPMPVSVYKTLEERAAADLARVPVESAVDRTRVIHIGYVLIGIIALCGLYIVLSPKPALTSVGRIIAPWSDVGAPTRVVIREVTPGDATAFHDQFLTVKAVVRGIDRSEPVTITYSTEDGQVLDRVVPMEISEDGYEHSAVLPQEPSGLQQDVTYFVSAGDARSPSYRIHVTSPPAIAIERVQYQFPAYTGFPNVETNQGDLSGIEGTRVTIRAQANHPIRSAAIDLDCDGTRDVTMEVSDKNATLRDFVLEMKKDRITPANHSYQILFTTVDGSTNPRPVRYKIEVIPDRPPQVELTSPRDKELPLPRNGSQIISVRGQDPDFALSRLVLRGEHKGRELFREPFVEKTPHRGEFAGKFSFDAAKHNLAVGDQIEYWAEAEDNRAPSPQVSRTERQKFVVVEANANNPAKDPRPQQDPNNPRANPAGNNADNKSQKPEENPKPQPDQPAENPQNKPNENPPRDDQPQNNNANEQKREEPQRDAETDPGEFIQDLLKDRAREEAQRNKNDDPQKDDLQKQDDRGGKPKPEDKDPNAKPDESPQNNAQQNSEDKQGASKPGDKGSKSQNNSGNGTSEDSDPNGNQKPGGKPDTSKKPDAKDNNQNSSGDPNADDSNSGKPDMKKPGRKPENNQGDPNDGEGDKPGEKPSQNKPGKPGNKKPDGNSPGEKNAGDNPGEDAAKKPGNQQGSSKKPGDDNSQKKPGDDSQKNGEQGTGDSGKPDSKKPGGKPDNKKPDNKPNQSGADGDGEQQPGGKPDQKSVNKSGKSPKDGQPSEDGDENAKPEPGANNPGNKGTKTEGKNDTKADPNAGGKPDGDIKSGKSKPTKRPDNDSPPQTDEQKGNDAEGQGGATKAPGNTKEQKPGKPDANEKRQGGDPNSEKGDSGAGKGSDEDKGTASPQEGNMPRNGKNGEDEGQKKSGGDEPGSPSTSPKESKNSKSDEKGDRSGGGGSGGGQKANTAGTGGAGTNTASDQGASKSNGSGTGEDADRPGTKKEAGKKTGKSGGKGDGPGTKGRPSDAKLGEGENPDSDPDNTGAPQKTKKPQQGKPADPNRKPDQDPDSNNGNGQGSSAGEDAGHGHASGEGPSRPGGNPANKASSGRSRSANTEVDDANLEYARKQTDLALEHLRDLLKRSEDDPSAIKKLDRSPEDARRFLKHWEQLQAEAQKNGAAGEAGRRRMEDMLKGLGLTPKGTQLHGDGTNLDQQRGIDKSRRGSPPPKFLERYRAFNEDE